MIPSRKPFGFVGPQTLFEATGVEPDITERALGLIRRSLTWWHGRSYAGSPQFRGQAPEEDPGDLRDPWDPWDAGIPF